MIIKTLSKNPPKKANSHDAGVDLIAAEKAYIAPHQTKLVDVGLTIAIPEGYCGLVMSRSGLTFKGIVVAQGVGLIDSGYRGPVKVLLLNTQSDHYNDYVVEVGDRIAQLVIIKHENVWFETVDKLDDTSRGEGGFGSSGR